MSKIVFVIGAGASAEFKLPTGDKLRKDILRLIEYEKHVYPIRFSDLEFDLAIKKYIKDKKCDGQKLLDAIDLLANALPLSISIDNLINSHKGNRELEFCGKIGIVKSILNAERNSSLYQNFSKTIRPTLEDSWLTEIFKLITEDCTIGDIKEKFDRIAFVIFNYDRCVEYFFINALVKFYGMQEDVAAEIMSSVEIHHPYGVVGKFPKMKRDMEVVGFGEEIKAKKLVSLSSEIKTFSESENYLIDDGLLKKTICNSRTIIFLGFAFHDINMSLLDPEDTTTSKTIFSSTFGMSTDYIDVVQGKLRRIFGSYSDFDRMKKLECKEFIREFSGRIRMCLKND